MKHKIFQTLPDEKLLQNDCLRNSYKISLDSDVEIEVLYDIESVESKELAYKVISKIADALPL